MVKTPSFALLSNAFYLIPIYLSFKYSLSLVFADLIILFFASSAFHLYKSKNLSLIDTCSSYATVAVCGILLAYGNNKFAYAVVILAVIGLIIRFYIEDGTRDDRVHGFWHVVASLIICLCVLGFI